MIVGLSVHQNSSSLQLKFTPGWTATGDALYDVRTKIMPGARKGVPAIVFVMTDGRSNYGRNVLIEARKLKKTGAKIITIGVGHKIYR